ncbi:MAG: polysaccharide deacetylase family protein [Chitinivibrionales bacterium]|nr:polysaccharide deacetylase family protein [Chitinivibrionales bacterium]MBD3357857.1 polysaccharide deacetylase family protein [Chitinivibrionales bacterium]
MKSHTIMPPSACAKSYIKHVLSAVLHYSGALLLLSGITKNRLTIINCHRVVPEETIMFSANYPMMVSPARLESLLKLIATYANPISLPKAISHIYDRRAFKPRTVALTFDDGYADNYTVAFPLLQKHSIPATIFLATGYIGGERNLWWDEVEYFFRLPNASQLLEYAAIPKSIRTIMRDQVQTQWDREKAARFIRRELYRIPHNERIALVDGLWNCLTQDEKPSPLMLDWSQVKAMNGLISFGSHTVTHVFADQVDATKLGWELRESKTTIEERTGVSCDGIAYPAGKTSKRFYESAEKYGYKWGVTTAFRNNSHSVNPMGLARKDIRYFVISGDTRVASKPEMLGRLAQGSL